MGLVSPQKQIFWQKIFAVAAIYLGLQLSILLITGSGWKKFWVLLPPEAFQYWDAIHYASLAVNSSCGAFYPLWPDLVRTLRAPSTLAEALRFAIPLSEVIFLASLPLALHSFNRILKHRNLALLVFVLYALGPNSIFYAIGYTEALFGALRLLFLLSLHLSEQQQSSTILQLGAGAALFSLAALTNLVRPALIQSTFAISFALIVSTLIHRSTSSSLAFLTKPLTLASLIGAGSLVGYGVYGTFCHTTAGDYLAPFQAQVAWGRTLAFRPWLLLFPRSLLVDLQGLYTPFLIFLTLGGVLWATMRRQVFTLYLPRPEWIYLFLVHPLVFSGIWIALTRFAKQPNNGLPLPTSIPTQCWRRWEALRCFMPLGFLESIPSLIF